MGMDGSPAKCQARWQWITQHEQVDPDTCSITTRHTFWLPGFSNDKLKDDRMIAAGGYKILNYSEFREVIKNVALEIQSKSLGPIEVGNLTRRQWNALNKPIVSDLKKRVARKNKKARRKSAGPPAKQSKQNPPAPSAPQEVAQTPQVGAVGAGGLGLGCFAGVPADFPLAFLFFLATRFLRSETNGSLSAFQ